MHVAQAAKSGEHIARQPSVASPRAARIQLLNDALTGAVAVVVGAAAVASLGESSVDRAAVRGLQLPAGLVGRLVEAERLRAIEWQTDAAKALATGAVAA